MASIPIFLEMDKNDLLCLDPPGQSNGLLKCVKGFSGDMILSIDKTMLEPILKDARLGYQKMCFLHFIPVFRKRFNVARRIDNPLAFLFKYINERELRAAIHRYSGNVDFSDIYFVREVCVLNETLVLIKIDQRPISGPNTSQALVEQFRKY